MQATRQFGNPHSPLQEEPISASSRRRPGSASGPAKPTSLLCLDIETVPDETLLPPDWEKGRFPKLAWHRIVAIAFASVRIDVDPETGLEIYVVEDCRSGGDADWDEARLLRGFWQFFAAGRYRLVTWNGRGFDLQVLVLRAFMHGIPTSDYFVRGDRWSGYTQRYAQEFHADLMDLMSQHGAGTRMGLDEMALAMGLPGKAGEHGGNVNDLVEKGRIERVRAYCECDVLNTLALYFRWCLISGRSDTRGHDASMLGLADYLRGQAHQRPHLAKFMEAWESSARPAPMLINSVMS